jgi:hypothetical protein
VSQKSPSCVLQVLESFLSAGPPIRGCVSRVLRASNIQKPISTLYASPIQSTSLILQSPASYRQTTAKRTQQLVCPVSSRSCVLVRWQLLSKTLVC